MAFGDVDQETQDFLNTPFGATLRRFIAFIFGLLIVLLNNKFGLHLGAAEITGCVALVVGYLAQSVLKTTVKIRSEAHVAAASQIMNDTAAALELSKPALPAPAGG